MHTITALRATGLSPDQVRTVIADYLALKRARTFRRACVTRFGALATAFGIAGFGAHWLTPVVSWFSVAMCGVAPTWAWIAELRREWSLSSRLDRLSDTVIDISEPFQRR